VKQQLRIIADLQVAGKVDTISNWSPHRPAGLLARARPGSGVKGGARERQPNAITSASQVPLAVPEPVKLPVPPGIW
jgi:hypothetical protein